MFFFIGGVQPKWKSIEKKPFVCPVCGHTDVFLKRVDNYLSLFFIPILPLKKGIPFLQCNNCKSVLDEQGKRVDFSGHYQERKCPYCGRLLQPDFSFCPYCGKTV